MNNGRKIIPTRLRFLILQRDNFACVICGSKAKDGVKLEIDHKIPVALGGTNEATNLFTLCNICNSGKSAFLVPNLPNVAVLQNVVKPRQNKPPRVLKGNKGGAGTPKHTSRPTDSIQILEALRFNQGLTRKQLSEISGVSTKTIQRLEDNSYPVGASAIWKIAKALGMTNVDIENWLTSNT